MNQDIIKMLLFGGVGYISIALSGKANNEKYYIFLNDFFKCILGYFFWSGNRFALKSIVAQIGNLISIIVGITLAALGVDVAKDIFLFLEIFNIFIVFIVALFVNDWRANK
ncbi:MAG: hypothetical protein AB6733_17420 [Clostridiaceae bacterium]